MSASLSGGLPDPPGVLRLGRRDFPAGHLVVMAIVNRTPDSFYRPGLTWDPAAKAQDARRIRQPAGQ
jgi:dihydropteroate synthase